MKSRYFVYVLIFFIIASSVYGCRHAGVWLARDDHPVKADALVMLMGSIPDRVLKAADLYKKKAVHRVILVEESMGAYQTLAARGVKIISNTTQASNALINLGIPSDSITILPGDATSTQMEAAIIKNYLANKANIDTLILVSSAQHMRRAGMIFTTAFKKRPNPIKILCSSNEYSGFDPENWWKNKENAEIVVLEYMKLLNYAFFEKRKL
jgi:uncharacterized SAM-binding protein YcdF (DUF218 family)